MFSQDGLNKNIEYWKYCYYTFSSTATSRAFFAHMNFESTIIQDPAVRRAIAMGIDKERFVRDLLGGNGYPAIGVYPDNFSFGGDAVTAREYDPDGARAVLEAAGWVDTDGDGIREKNGQTLTCTRKFKRKMKDVLHGSYMMDLRMRMVNYIWGMH